MLKRQRSDSPKPPSATAPATAALANWCDDQLKEAAESYNADDDTEVSLWAPAATTAVSAFMDNAFAEFLEGLEREQCIRVGEVNRDYVANAWRECGMDATLVLRLKCQLDTDGRVMSRFCVKKAARNASRELAQQNEELFDKWNFDLAWELAETILSIGGDASSEEEDDDDEPVEESDSDEGSEEDESEEGGEGEEEEGEEEEGEPSE